MEQIRAEEPCFSAEAEVFTEDSGSCHVLAVCRRLEGRELICLFNFSGAFVQASVDRKGTYRDLMYGVCRDGLEAVPLYPHSFAWLLREEP